MSIAKALRCQFFVIIALNTSKIMIFYGRSSTPNHMLSAGCLWRKALLKQRYLAGWCRHPAGAADNYRRQSDSGASGPAQWWEAPLSSTGDWGWYWHNHRRTTEIHPISTESLWKALQSDSPAGHLFWISWARRHILQKFLTILGFLSALFSGRWFPKCSLSPPHLCVSSPHCSSGSRGGTMPVQLLRRDRNL